MSDLQTLLDRESELQTELEKVRQHIHNHPERVRERINDGINEFSKLIHYDKNWRSKTKKISIKIMKESLTDYEVTLDADQNDIRPARHYLHRFYLEDEWEIIVGIFLESGHQKYELSVNIKRGDTQINISGYEVDIDGKMCEIDTVMKHVPAYIYYKSLIRTFIKLLYANLLNDYFN
jgi:hypothetical protein